MEESTNSISIMSNVSDYVQLLFDSEQAAKDDAWSVSDQVVWYLEIANVVILSGLLSLLGIATNTVNLIVFFRLGFKDTINITLFALAISDLGSSVFLAWVTVCYNPLVYKADSDILFLDLEFYTGMWPRGICLTITSFLTVFVTIERYLCIEFPLKVKELMTQRRVTIIVLSIYLVIIATKIQNYFGFRFDWEWVPWRNKTMFGVTYGDYRAIELASQQLQTFYLLTSFTTVAVCTGLFVWKLNQRSKWRQSATGGKEVTSSVRDKQIIKMVTCIAVIFIVCFFPYVLMCVFMISSPDFDIGEKHENAYFVIVTTVIPVGAVNSTVNILVYYKMMSKFKIAMRSILCMANTK